MNIKSTIITLLLVIAICNVQAITISGVVKNSAGKGIEGAKVRLGKADITTTTGSDGSFTLKDATALGHQTNPAVLGSNCPFTLEGATFYFSVTEQSKVNVMAYDCNGKLLSSQSKTVLSTDHSLTLPHSASGIRIYRVSVNSRQYTFKNVAGTAANRSTTSTYSDIASVKQAKVTAEFDDALLFIKAGYQLSRIAMTKPDTSGLQITMTPLDTGSVTDADGNVYQTVRIGSQYWTAENLRTTKFNDGSSIGSACTFYKNTTDAAAKKKWGALYEYSAAKSGKLAPKGWHVPTKAEWDTLLNYLVAHGYNYDGSTSGNKVAKSMAATTDWQTSTETGAVGNDLSINNASGFSALPAGWRYWSGNEYKEQTSQAFWWTSTPKDGTYSYLCQLWYINFDLTEADYVYVQCSVRLVKDN